LKEDFILDQTQVNSVARRLEIKDPEVRNQMKGYFNVKDKIKSILRRQFTQKYNKSKEKKQKEP
jgi:hypothetical protein